jgi:poly-gamma-glutamate capsule biosynthesis protein CapA/YwtB (metallophosphatase superfamily)
MRLGLAGDTMLGRSVAEKLSVDPPASLFAPELVEVAREADLLVLNLECCISERGDPWPDPRKPFFFRAPPVGIEALTLLGVDCVTLANNHALDYGVEALIDTLALLDDAGIACVGAGADVEEARRPAVLEGPGGARIAVLGLSDHPVDFAATPERAGVAFAELRDGVPAWVRDAIGEASRAAAAVLVTPHWGPNMTTNPRPHVRDAAHTLVEAGATLVAGHSAHVFHGVEGRVLYDLGDFLDDYLVDRRLRNDLGLFWLVDLSADAEGTMRPLGAEAVPLRLDFCHTRLADADDAAWIARRFRDACAALGTEAELRDDGHLIVELG